MSLTELNLDKKVCFNIHTENLNYWYEQPWVFTSGLDGEMMLFQQV